MSVIAEISEGKENPSCLADMRFFPIVLCSMLHCLEICQGAVSAGESSHLSAGRMLWPLLLLLYGIPQSGGLYRLSCFL